MNMSTVRDEARTTTDPAQLAAHARLAYEQKQTRECIALVRQLLTLDEHNTEARVLLDAIRSDMQRDVDDARALLEDSRKREDGQKYRKAAEIILLKIIYIDPEHSDAKALLASVKGGAEPPPLASTPVYTEMPKRRKADDEFGFTAHPEPVEQMLEPEGRRRKIPVILLGPVLVLVLAGVFYFRPKDSSEPAKSAADPAAAAVIPAASIAPPVTSPSPLPLPNNPGITKTADLASTAAIAPRVPAPPPAVVPPPPAPVEPAVPVNTGSLTVSAVIPADIYMGDKHLGTTPTTLQLAAGRYNLEYRHGELRTLMTHEIKARKTTTAVVPFETTVQINARPWAQVFVEGTARQALGQTPLSSVRVPVGSVLTFENPNFPPKSHRVKETDTSIQMAFP
jgi:hypothetical protein